MLPARCYLLDVSVEHLARTLPCVSPAVPLILNLVMPVWFHSRPSDTHRQSIQLCDSSSLEARVASFAPRNCSEIISESEYLSSSIANSGAAKSGGDHRVGSLRLYAQLSSPLIASCVGAASV